MADVHCPCGGKGWRWTGRERVACTCIWAREPARDPVRDAYDLVPVEAWRKMVRAA